jgi:hypothetical protein
MPKYQVTDSRGKVHKRNSTGSGRTYAFAVVTHFPAAPAEGTFLAREKAYDKVEWRRDRALAEQCASQTRKYFNGRGVTVEIIEAKEV